MKPTPDPEPETQCDRRAFLTTAVGALALAPLRAQSLAPAPISPVATPCGWARAEPLRYPDPGVVYALYVETTGAHIA